MKPKDDVVDECRRAVAAGASPSEIVDLLRVRGVSVLMAIKVVRDVLSVPLGKAKSLVTRHPAWRSEVVANEPLHDAAERQVAIAHLSREGDGDPRNSMKALTPAEFLRTVYFGDRACKAIRIESWKNEVVLEVDKLSRIRSLSGKWEFYGAEDIADGRIVFTGVEVIRFEPPGPIPNDFIHELSARPAGDASDSRWLFEASISAVAPDGTSTEVIVRIVGSGVHIEDPAREDLKIRE